MSYVASVEAALSTRDNAQVISGGPGVTSDHFGIAGDFGRGAMGPHWFTRMRHGLRPARRSWRQLKSEIYRLLSRWLKPALRVQGLNPQPRPSVRTRLRLRLHAGAKALLGRAPARWTALPLRMISVLIAILAIIPSAYHIIGQLVRRGIHIGEARKMLLRAHPDILVVMEDNAEGLTGAVTHAARRLGIPIVILPDYIPNPIEPAQYYSQIRSHVVNTYLDRLVTFAYPKWAFKYRNKTMLRLPSTTIIAYHMLGCDPPAPWILNAGYASAIALDSDTMLARYLDLGFRRDVLHVIGTAQDDKLYQRFSAKAALRQRILHGLGLQDDLPLIVCALPPDQYSSSDTNRFEFSSYGDLVRAWFGDLAALASSANVLVRPHPRTPREILAPFCPPGVHIMPTPTEDLVPICDLYVASISTTIRWALSLGIPVVNYDCYRYAYGDFTKAKGVVEVTDRPHFAAALGSIIHDQAVRDDLQAAAFGDRAFWGKVDGHYQERLAALLQDVRQSAPPQHATHADTSTLT